MKDQPVHKYENTYANKDELEIENEELKEQIKRLNEIVKEKNQLLNTKI